MPADVTMQNIKITLFFLWASFFVITLFILGNYYFDNYVIVPAENEKIITE